MAQRSSPRDSTSIKCDMQQKEELDLRIFIASLLCDTFPLFSNRVREMHVDWYFIPHRKYEKTQSSC